VRCFCFARAPSESHHRAAGQNRFDARDTQLDRFLHRVIHALGAGQTLREDDCERRLARGRTRGFAPAPHVVFRARGDERGVVGAVAVEKRQR
jgi:hypothetical protein